MQPVNIETLSSGPSVEFMIDFQLKFKHELYINCVPHPSRLFGILPWSLGGRPDRVQYRSSIRVLKREHGYELLRVADY